MFYLFLRSKPGDTFIQSCKKLPDCQKCYLQLYLLPITQKFFKLKEGTA